MSDIKMGHVISEIKNPTRRLTLLQRMMRVVKYHAAKAAWSLWGRKKAFKRMQKLAISRPTLYLGEYCPTKMGTLELENELIAKCRMNLGSLEVDSPLPKPDVDDSGMN